MKKHLFLFLLFLYPLFALDNFQVFYTEDLNSKATIDEIKAINFTKTTKNNFNLGYHKGSIWFKIIVENRSDTENFILTVNEHFYEIANLYYENNGAMEKLSNSLFSLISQREIKSNQLAFALKLPHNTPQTLYLQLHGKYAYFGKIEILEKEYFYIRQSMGINSFFTFALGVIFVLMFFTLFLYTKTKEIIYLYYVGYSFFMLLYFINITGLLVYLDLQTHIYKFQLTASIMMGFLVLFSKEYLQTKKYLPKVDTLLTLLALLFFVIGVLIFNWYQPWNMILNNGVGFVCIVLIIVSIVVYFKGHKQSKYYTMAMMLYLVSVFLFTFMIKGSFEYTFLTRYGFVAGIIIEMILFSYLLSNRHHLSKESIQNYLEKEVALRTNQLKIVADERELLLKELHHRVKNNFHMITGLLWMEEQKDNRAKERFQNLRARIKSMSIIHEKLYKSKDISHIALDEYIEEIITNTLMSHKDRKIFINRHIENIVLKFEDALSIGFITTEILHNCLKHNPKQKTLDITLVVKVVENIFTMSIKDNGTGFQNKNENENEGVGLGLIESFAKSLHNGSYDFISDNGLEFILRFEVLKEEG